MALNNITFNLGQGGLGRPLPGEDYISGLLFYSAALPSGFTTSNRIQRMLALGDAVALGITNTHLGETRSTATYLVTSIGAAGDTITITAAEPNGAVTLVSYTVLSTDISVAILGQSIASAINTNTLKNGGYIASASAGTITITARPGLGIYFNTGLPYTVTIVGTVAGTLTQSVIVGVASVIDVWYYHISEFFRLQPQGILYVGIYAIPSPYTFIEITTMQNFANGKIRQIGVYKDSAAFASGDITLIHGICAANVALHKEIIALYGADISATANVATLPDLSALTANYCSAVISQDGGASGSSLFAAYGKSITTLGATLGAVSRAKVSQSIAWVAQFNISAGAGLECDIIAFANGVLFSNASVTDGLLTTMQNMRYIFLRKFVGIAGSFFNENSTSITTTSNYAFIADNRTIQKATREIYKYLIPALNSPITLNADGTLSNEAIAYFGGLAEAPLNQMIRDGELSGMKVTINAIQNVLTTGILVVSVSLVQIATARNINVNIGYNVTV